MATNLQSSPSVAHPRQMPNKPPAPPTIHGDGTVLPVPIADLPNTDPAATNDGIPPITECVDRVMQDYFKLLNGEHVSDIYQSVLDQVEPPLLRCVLHHTERNQSAAAKVLGISRATLRRKLERHGLRS